MQTITLANQARPVNFGKAAIMELESLTGRGFYDFLFSMLPEKSGAETSELEAGIAVLQKAKVTDMVHVLYAGLYGGTLKNQGPPPLSLQEVIDLLDEEEDSLTPLVQALGMALDSLPKAGDNGQKKREPKKRKPNLAVRK